MTHTEHIERAELLLERLQHLKDTNPQPQTVMSRMIAEAQVHATLALATRPSALDRLAVGPRIAPDVPARKP